jgi:fibronectin-binding autotransporter adhesin
MKRSTYLNLASLLLPCAIIVPAHAVDFNWDGQNGFAWNTTTQNWGPTIFWPATGTDNDAIFGTTGVGIVAVDAAGISANDLTFGIAGYEIAGPGVLTLNGSPNIITASGATIVSANLAGTSGLTKAGTQRLTLTGNNSGLSGTLTVNDEPATNNNGVWPTSLESLGGITTVNINGTGGTGGHIRLSGTGIAVPATVAFNLFGQGGNSAPAGTLIGGGTGVNSIAGPITLNTNGTRISNSGATRFDITGPITQAYTSLASDGILFRFADNEGIHLTNTGNSWTVNTINSQGILWAEPGALPTTTNLLLAGSGDGVFQTSGTFDRAVGNGANQVLWQTVQNGARTGGLSARGGDLTVNLGGAAADLKFYPFSSTNGTRSTTTNPTIITAINTANLVVGMAVSGTGIPANATITAVGANTITLSAAVTSAGTNAVVSSQGSPTTVNMNGLLLNVGSADSKLTLVNPLDLNGAGRTLRVDTNTVELTGGVKNTGAGTAVLTKTNGGTLLLTSGVTGATGITTNGGIVEVSGSGANTYTGGVNVNGGNLLIKRSDGLGTTAGGTTSAGGSNQGILQFDATGGDLSIPENITLGMRSSLVANSASSMKPNINNLAGNTELTGLVNGVTGGAVTKISSDGGLLTISAELRQSGASPIASSRFTNLQGSGNGLISGLITQAANITHRLDKMGIGSWKFTNPGNTFSGGVRVLEGTLEVTGIGDGAAASAVLGTATNLAANIQINGGALKYSGAGESSDRLFTIGAAGATIDASGAGALVLSNTGAVATADGGGTGIQYSFATAATTVASNDTTLLHTGMEIGGVAGLEAGTKITAINHSTGLLTIDIPTTAAAIVTNTGTASGISDRTLTLTGTNIAANELAAALSDATNGGKLAVTKSGAGSWVLSGATSNHSGPTTVNEGTLRINGSLTASPVTVAATATLGGNATLGSTLTAAGTVAPGNSTGTLAAGNTTLTGTYACELDGTAKDLLAVTGDLNITGATLAVSVLGGGATETSYVIASYTGSLTGTFNVSPALPAGYSLDYDATNKQIKLVSSATGFASWIAGFSVADPSQGGDPDFDGLANAVEYVIGGNPGIASQTGRPQSSVVGNDLVFSFSRVDSSETPDVAVAVEIGTSLDSWPTVYNVGADTAGSSAGVSVSENGTDPDTITVTIPKAADLRKFARLRVTVTP